MQGQGRGQALAGGTGTFPFFLGSAWDGGRSKTVPPLPAITWWFWGGGTLWLWQLRCGK